MIDNKKGKLYAPRIGEVNVTVTDAVSGIKASHKVRVIDKIEDTEVKLNLDGDYAYFGSFPQSKLKNEKVMKAIKKANTGDSRTVEVDGVVYWRVDNKDNRNLKAREVEYYISEPIKWSILEKTKKSILLIAEYNLESHRYSKEGTKSSTWKESELRAWLNGLGDYKSDYGAFWRKAFTEAEFDALLPSKIDGVSNKVYILDKAGVMNTKYGFSSDSSKHASRVFKSTEYALANGAYTMNGTGSWWWIRTIGSGSSSLTDGGMAFVYDGGALCATGMPGENGAFGVRPVIRVNLSKCTIE